MLEVCVDSVARAVSAEADVARATQLIASIHERRGNAIMTINRHRAGPSSTNEILQVLFLGLQVGDASMLLPQPLSLRV